MTAFSFSLLSAGTRRPSSSFRERCSATPCLATSSLQVPRSSSFSERLRMVPWSSLLSAGEGVPSSSSPESSVERRRVVLRAWRGGGQDGGAGRAARTERCLGEGGGPPAPQRAGRRGDQLEWQRLAELCRLKAGWAAPIPDPWEEAESPNHRPGPTAPAAPHCPHLTSLSALHPPPDPASGLPLCVPGSTPAHLPRPPWRPPRPQSQPLPAAAGLPEEQGHACLWGLACGDTGRGLSTALSGRDCAVPRGQAGDGARGGEVQPHAPPAPSPQASLPTEQAPHTGLRGPPAHSPPATPSPGAPGALGTPSYSLGYLGAWPLASPACVRGGAPWRVRRVDGGPRLCSHFNTSL